MHIVLSVLTAIVTILYLLDRMGFDLGGLNPFYWRRRRAWARQYQGDPIFAVEDPMEVAALFVVAVAKLDGDITLEQKKAILSEFSSNFSLSERDASQLLGSSTHLLGHPQVIGNQVQGLLGRHDKLFSPDQAESLVAMIRTVAEAGGDVSDEQRDLMAAVEKQYLPATTTAGAWG